MQRILITEDDRFTANICREKFQQEGYEVLLAHDGREAIRLLKSHPPDLIVLDLMLPEIDGIGVLRFIRTDDALRPLPVIVLSNSTYFSGLARSALEAGATRFLNKGDHGPVSLLAAVKELLWNPVAAASPPPASSPLPFVAAPSPAAGATPTDPLEPPPLPPRAFIKPAKGPIRVIIADDDRVIHGILGFLMEQAGFVVRSAFDGRRALEMAEADPPDIMILDGMMPELDGFEVLKLWHHHPRLATIPVIMLTAQKAPEKKSGALGSGAVEFLTKPFSPDNLVRLIEEYVGQREPSPPQPAAVSGRR